MNLDTLLAFLAANLPLPLYFFVVRVLSHSLAALTAIYNLGRVLLANTPSDWNAQALLPPIITIFAAYIALASLYRTTTWFLRVMFWFMKWGTLFGIIMAGAGYIAANTGHNPVGNQGILPMLAGYLFNSQDLPQTNYRTTPQSKSAKKRRPKAWESFERHQEWQAQQETAAQDQNAQLSQVMDILSGVAGQVLGGNWWKVLGDEVPESDGTKKSPKRAGRSNSR